MRILAIGAIALATTFAATGLARAFDEPSRQDADNEAEMAAEYHAMPSTHMLGYAQHQSRWQGHPAATTTFRTPAFRTAPQSADDAFLRQGDRGLGND